MWPPDTLSDTQIDATLRAIIESLDGVARLIGTPRRPTLTAVIYPSRSELFAVTCVPGWVDAVYDGTLRLVAAPEQPSGVGLLQLRHESTHAQLTPALPNSPTWFQEGLASTSRIGQRREGRLEAHDAEPHMDPFRIIWTGSFQSSTSRMMPSWLTRRVSRWWS